MKSMTTVQRERLIGSSARRTWTSRSATHESTIIEVIITVVVTSVSAVNYCFWNGSVVVTTMS